jgi:general secretion pathway protein D
VIDLTQGGTDQGGVPIRISADASNNSVITYTDGETYKEVLAALRALDSTPLQVAINVIIAEVKLNNDLRYGVQYFVKSGSLDGGSGSVSLFSEAANALQKQIPGFNFLVGTNADPDLVISALDRITDVEVLSSPSLVVMENQTASLQVGDEVPITVRQSQSVEDPRSPIINQIEFRNTGIILTVTPRIGQNDAVTMQIEQEISNVNGGQNTLTPTISKRKIASSISVVSGQTVLLAGLISQNRESGRNGIPGLGRLPGVGGLFSSRTKAEGRTELVVLIRPVVVRNGEDAQSVAEEFRGRLLMLGSPEPAPRAARGAYKN